MENVDGQDQEHHQPDGTLSDADSTNVPNSGFDGPTTQVVEFISGEEGDSEVGSGVPLPSFNNVQEEYLDNDYHEENITLDYSPEHEEEESTGEFVQEQQGVAGADNGSSTAVANEPTDNQDVIYVSTPAAQALQEVLNAPIVHESIGTHGGHSSSSGGTSRVSNRREVPENKNSLLIKI